MKRRGMLLGLASGVASVLGARAAVAARDHTGLRSSLGPTRAPHAMPGCDARRSRSSRVKLAPSPSVQGRLRVALGIGRGLVTREDGGFFVLHPNARASRFDAQGKLLLSLKLGNEASSAAVVVASGQIAFLCGGELWLVDEHGQLQSRTPLGEPDLSARSVLGTRDGGVLLASGNLLTKVGAFGDLGWRKSVAAAPFELLETSVGEVAVSGSGAILRLDSAGRPTRLGELGGPAGAVTASANGSLLLVRSGNHRLILFDLAERRLRVTVEDPTLELDGPVFLDRDGTMGAFTSDGLLLRYRGDGSEAQRVPVDPGARKAPGAEDALLLGDGRLLLARAGADAALLTPGGEVSFIAGSACPDPLGLFPAGPRSVLLACRSGAILRLA
ncbi:MAG TPA: hypothetical protein VIW29_01050 [Polyangiaceae bacterium]